jgi:uncharacterized protein
MKLLFFILINSFLFAQPEIPLLKYYAEDYTSTLSSGELTHLNQKLKSFEDSTSNQLVFLMIPTLDNYPIDYYTMDAVEKNKIGQEGRDNGILFLVVKEEREMRIEVGYGLEGALPDALAGSIIRNIITPNFRANNFFKGINEGIDAITAAVKGEFTAGKREENQFPDIIFILFALFFLSSIFRKRGGKAPGNVIFYPGGFGGRSGGYRSGSSGGGFRGGGGSFGGGGASGRW